MSFKKELSIITVNLNNKCGLELTAKSVLSQQKKDLIEWIVIDGGSNDGSLEIIENHIDYISYWISEPDDGIYNAMNKGIDVVTGNYILFLNSGDALCNSNVFENLYKSIYYGKYDYLAGNTVLVNNKYKLGEVKSPECISAAFFFRDNLCHQSVFIHKKRFKNKRYDQSLRIVSDAKFFFEDIILNNASYKHLSFDVSNYDLSGISASNWYTTSLEKQKYLHEFLPPRIYCDYEHLVFGNTVLEKLLSRLSNNSVRYKLITVVAVILYFPTCLYNRFKIKYQRMQQKYKKYIE